MDPLATSFLFAQFLDQHRYLKNVTPSTIEWYQTAFKALQKAHASTDPVVSKASLQNFAVSVRQRGVKPVSCNTYIKALNAFCLWLHQEGHVAERLTLPLLRFEKRIIVTLTDDQMHRLLKQKPKRFDQWRLHAIIGLLLDSGLRIEEALTRHTFATNYLRQGGDIVRLSMVLGHTQITTTQRYLHLLTEDLSASHQKVSILNRLG